MTIADAPIAENDYYTVFQALRERSMTPMPLSGMLVCDIRFSERDRLVKKYAWAIPTNEALDAIARHAPQGIIEIGAGTGYWASLLRERGVDVLAFDMAPLAPAGHAAPYLNRYHGDALPWTQVELGTEHILMGDLHHERALFLCWPPYADDMAANALRFYRGDTLIYIGESGGGCTGDDAFHGMLEQAWEEVACVGLPQFPGIHDDLTIYRRNGARGAFAPEM